MADNQTIHNGDAGNGTAFDAVADEITSPYTGGTAKAQGVKLLGGAANSNEVIEGTAANGLEVDVTRIAAGSNIIGKVRLVDADGDEITVVGGALTVSGGAAGVATADQAQTSSGLTTATTNYTTGDTVGAGWTFTGMATASGGHGVITGVALIDEGDVVEGLALWFFSGSVTFGTDNAAPSISDADARKHVAGPVAVPVTDLGGCRAGSIHSLRVPYTCDATSLYVYATTLSANNFFAAVGDLKLTLFYEVQD